MTEKYIKASDCEKYFYEHLDDVHIVGAMNAIDEMPNADVVLVVRCRDCKYYDKKYHQCKLHSEEPDQYSTGFIFNLQEDDFCSYGERREYDNG